MTVSGEMRMRRRIRLAEMSLLLAVLGIEPSEYTFVSREAQSGYLSDIGESYQETAPNSAHQERVIELNLPSFRNYFPDEFCIARVDESDRHPGMYEDKNFYFWSAFDTVTYRFWLQFHIFKLRMLLYAEDFDVESLFWARFGTERPDLPADARKRMLLFRFFAPFFRGRRQALEQVLPAFLKKAVTVKENQPRRIAIPDAFKSRLGANNSTVGRDLMPSGDLIENHSTFEVCVTGLVAADIEGFRPGGAMRCLAKGLIERLTPAQMSSRLTSKFAGGLRLFRPGAERTAYLGFSTYLRESI
jgi:hypothetical protein